MRIAITGGIGSGKSTACRYLESLGHTVLDADAIAREVSGWQEVVAALVKEFQGGILRPDGAIDRAALAAAAFQSRDCVQKLNAIMHPFIISEIHRLTDLYRDKLVFIEIPLLFECGMAQGFDAVWLVTAQTRTRIARVQKRSNLTEAEIRQRMENQMREEEKAALSNVVLHNDGGERNLRTQIDAALAALKCGGTK